MLADAKDRVHPGCEELVEAIDLAASAGDVDEITRAVQEALSRLASSGRVVLPDELRRSSSEAYARRLIFHSESLAYTVLAMVWGPGQGTPVHDHSGMWCVEGVVEGRIAVTQYDLVERQGDRCRFERQETVDAGVGSSGRLIPPFDYHTIANTADDDCAITIHVYGGEMVRCMIYEPLADDWYQEQERALSYTS
jgi:predicted metal-dependent enzyme (double-stranded beta helix superfamily)